MKHLMEFPEFFGIISTHFCNHNSLTWANYRFLSEFINENAKMDNFSFQANIPPTGDRLHISNIQVKDLIYAHTKTFGLEYQDSLRAIWFSNSKYLNDRAINGYYAAISKYLEDRGNSEFYEFHDKYDWFKVLYILRNLASHGHHIYKRGIEFPDTKQLKGKIKPYPDTLTWKTISIIRGQKTEPMINEVQVANLLSYIMTFFAGNPDFNVGISHSQNTLKPK